MIRSTGNSWIKYIKARKKANRNFVGFVAGKPGSGKSWACLKLGQDLDKDFNIDRVVFSGKELMALIESDKLKKGSVIIFEECGVEMSHRNWQSVINKMLNFLFQTFRHRCFILIMNAPYLDFVDASTRKLFDAEFKTLTINKKEKICAIKPQLIQYNSRTKKFYYKYLRIIKDRKVMPVKEWGISKPSDDLIAQYELKKRKFTDRLNKEIHQELNPVKKIKMFLKCPFCDYEWKPKNEVPPATCPRCRKPLIDPIFLENGPAVRVKTTNLT